MSENKCLICGSKYVESPINGLKKCSLCGFITTDLEISEDELKKLYSEDYFNGQEYGDYLSDKIVIQKNFTNRLKYLLKYIETPKNKTLFEIGSAYGLFLDLAKQYFQKVQGIDVCLEAVNYANTALQLDVIFGDFLKVTLNQKYDVFCMWDTIEHLKEPDLFIEKVSEHLNLNGLVAITTGDISSLNARIRGNRWRMIHPPTHLHYFSKNTLTKLLEKNGLEVIHTSHPGAYMSLNHILYITLVVCKKAPWLYKMLFKTGSLNKFVNVNMYDLLYVIARKRK